MTSAGPTFDAVVLRRFADLATESLGAAREEIDALNVYPVPDGDTGTNMFLTVEAARDAIRDVDGDDLGALLATYSRAALLGARGNSGVILSQLIRALLRRLVEPGPGEDPAHVFADGMRLAAEAAYAAVGKPVEGTMLTVARAAGDAAGEAARSGASLPEVVAAGAAGAREALARTPDQLPLLREAGVVDAGGRGLCVILDAAETALTGRRPTPTDQARPRRPIPAAALPTDDLTEDGPAYEVMYLLDAEDAAIATLRSRLGELGDSLVVVGGEGLWNVHVHTDDVGAAVEVGIDVGRPRRISVTHFAEQLSRARELRAARVGRAVVAVAAGAGLAALFEEAGAHAILGGPGRRPSTGEILAAVESTGAAEVIVLPNDPDSLGVAEAAASTANETGGAHVVVVPTRAQVQGIAALACHEPARSLESDVIAMTSAARGTRHGAVTIAARRAMTSAGPCEPGDVLGVVRGDFAVVGDDLATVAIEVLRRLLGSGGELVTVVSGEGGEGLAERCEEWVTAEHPGVDVLVYDGGQERYPLLVAVE